MMDKELGAAVVAVWAATLFVITMNAASARRTKMQFSERLAFRMAKKAAERKVRELRELDSSLPDDACRYLQREVALMNACAWASAAKAVIPFISSVFASVALGVRIAQSHLSSIWKISVSAPVMLGPGLATIALIVAADTPAQARWTQCIISSNIQRALLDLLRIKHSNNIEPPGDRPFQPSTTRAVRALEDLAQALEKYAVRRALPDGRTPMPEVVAEYGAAATLVRRLRDKVELDGECGREDAIKEVRRLIEHLTSSSMRGYADREEYPPAPLLDSHQRLRERKRQVFTLAVFTLSITGVLIIIGPTPAGAAVVGVGATTLLALWVKILPLPAERKDDRPA